MAGMRDKMIHDYFGRDYETVWMAATDDFPELLPLLLVLFNDLSK